MRKTNPDGSRRMSHRIMSASRPSVMSHIASWGSDKSEKSENENRSSGGVDVDVDVDVSYMANMSNRQGTPKTETTSTAEC